MAVVPKASLDTNVRAAAYQGGLARSLVRTLLIFTLIPLALMAGAAYLRSRTLLRAQVVGQMQAQLKDQIGRLDLTVKTKEIRLDRVARGPDRAAQLEAAIQNGSRSPGFATLRQDLSRELRAVNPDAGRATFSEYFIAGTDGTVVMASKPEWEGVSLKGSPLFGPLTTKDHVSFMLFDPAPLYPAQLILVTVSQLHAHNGAPIGLLVGVTESPELQSVLAGLAALNSSSEAFFVTQNGTMLGTDQYTNQVAPITLPSTQKILIANALDKMMGNTSAVPESIQFTDNTGAAAFGQGLWVSGIQAGIVYEIHQDTIFGPLNSLIPFSIALLLVTLAAMGIVLSLGAQRVFTPLARLAEITNRFANGDFAERAEVHSKDEIRM